MAVIHSDLRVLADTVLRSDKKTVGRASAGSFTCCIGGI